MCPCITACTLKTLWTNFAVFSVATVFSALSLKTLDTLETIETVSSSSARSANVSLFAFSTIFATFPLFAISSLYSAVAFISFGAITALFTASVLVADFCYDDPTQSISALTTNLSPFAESMISYYATCSGQNMLGESQAQAMADLAELKQELEMAKQHPLCEDTELQLMIGNIASKTETPLGDIHMAMQCDTLNEYFAEIVNDNLCDPFVEGMAQLWVMLAASGFVILVLLKDQGCRFVVTKAAPSFPFKSSAYFCQNLAFLVSVIMI